MAQSVEELRLESERNRVALAETVDQLRERLSDAAEDIRQRATPQHIKSEVSGFISDKARSWIGALKQQAMDNPMQAIAAGTAIGVPLLRLARGFPLPLLMMGAGLTLSSRTVRNRAADAAGPVINEASVMLDQATERAQALGSTVKDTISSAQSRAGGVANDLTAQAAQATGTVTDRLKGGIDAAKDGILQAGLTAKHTAEAAQDAAAAAPERARRIVGDNAALIGGLGIAIGAIIAAALPKTQAEAKVMGEASGSVTRAAKEAVQSGFETVKETTMSAADAAAKTVSEADLGAHASRITQNLTETLQEAAEGVVTAAVNPSQKSTI
jgi:hypothetical protein